MAEKVALSVVLPLFSVSLQPLSLKRNISHLQTKPLKRCHFQEHIAQGQSGICPFSVANSCASGAHIQLVEIQNSLLRKNNW